MLQEQQKQLQIQQRAYEQQQQLMYLDNTPASSPPQSCCLPPPDGYVLQILTELVDQKLLIILAERCAYFIGYRMLVPAYLEMV
jgi:hypothetical protein